MGKSRQGFPCSEGEDCLHPLGLGSLTLRSVQLLEATSRSSLGVALYFLSPYFSSSSSSFSLFLLEETTGLPFFFLLGEGCGGERVKVWYNSHDYIPESLQDGRELAHGAAPAAPLQSLAALGEIWWSFGFGVWAFFPLVSITCDK